MLLALREGEVVAWSSGLRDLGNFGEVEVEPRAVEQWLDYAGVLIDAPPPLEEVCCNPHEEKRMLWDDDTVRWNGRNAGNAGALCGFISDRDEDGNEKEEEEDKGNGRYDCGVRGCRKAFFHQHVGIKTEAQDGFLVSESRVVSSSPSDDV